MKNNKPSFLQVFPIISYVTVFLLIFVALLFVFRDKNVENFDNHAPSPAANNEEPNEEDPIEMANAIENFIRYPGLQMFCTVMKGNLATFWAKLPESKAEGHYVKLCCSSCYNVISKSLCEEGDYEVSTMTQDDITNLISYYNDNELTFGLDEDTINEQYGTTVLKLRHNDILYPVQVLKLREHIEEGEVNNELTYACE
jgi:hypothetical protein